MATIHLYRAEVEEQALPFVCLRCGRPASLWKAKRFLLATGAGDVGKLNRIEVPLCPAHKSHWFWRGLLVGGVGGVLVALFLSGLAAVAEPDTVPAAWRGALGVAFGLGFLGLVLWLPVMLVLYYTSIRPVGVTGDAVTLAGVSPAFVGALETYRRSHPDESQASRWDRRRRGRGREEI
jgi:hypothetical protein